MQMLLLAPTDNELNAIHVQHPRLVKKTCGVGGIAVTKFLFENIEPHYDFILLTGIAGGDISCSLGEVIKVSKAIQGDLGVFENDQFISFYDTGLIQQMTASDSFNQYDKIFPDLTEKKTLSTNILFESTTFNQLRHQYFDTQIEDMEGAAFQEFCNKRRIPFIHLRAISNYIGERNKKVWLIEEAMENLNNVLSKYLNTL